MCTVCVGGSAEPVRTVENSQQETDADVGRDQDCHSTELQDGWRSLVA